MGIISHLQKKGLLFVVADNNISMGKLCVEMVSSLLKPQYTNIKIAHWDDEFSTDDLGEMLLTIC